MILSMCTVPGPVEKLEVTALSDEVLHVSWDPPVTPNGVLTGYHVVVTNLIDSTKIIYEIPPRVHEWNISVGIGKSLMDESKEDILVWLEPALVLCHYAFC